MICPACNKGTVQPVEEKIELPEWGTLVGRCDNINCGQLIANWDKLTDKSVGKIVKDFENAGDEFVIENVETGEKCAVKVNENGGLRLEPPRKND